MIDTLFVVNGMGGEYNGKAIEVQLMHVGLFVLL